MIKVISVVKLKCDGNFKRGFITVKIVSFLKRVALGTVFCGVLAGFAITAYVISQAQDTHAKIVAELVAQDGTVAKAFFSPDDTIKQLLIGLIEAEKKHIAVAIYTFTEKDIAQALVAAHNRGVLIEVIADRSYGTDKYSKVPLLANNHIPVWVYQSDVDERKASLMHNKFCIFYDTVHHKTLVWTGSYNFTQRATIRNQENVIVLDDARIVQSFKQQFKKLKERSLLISGRPGSNCASMGKKIPMPLGYTLKQWLNKIKLPV